jgi:hypothetical protein
MRKKFNIVAALLALFIMTPAAYAANTDNPDGCKPTGLFGQFSEPFQPFEAAAAQTIAEGDPVKRDGSGQVTIAAVTDSSLLGFARTAVAGSSAGDLIYVYSDPNTVFECQCSGSFAITMVGSSVDLEGTTGIFEVNENATVYKPVRIVGYNAADAVGANARVYVRLNMASLGNQSDGVMDDLSVLGDFDVAGTLESTGVATLTAGFTDGTATLDGSGNLSGVDTLGVTGVATLAAGLTDGVATLDGSGGLTGVAGLAITGDFTLGGHKAGQALFMGSFDYPEDDGTEWWGVAGAAALPQNITAKACYINLSGLKVGDEIGSYTLLGSTTEAATLTLDATLVEVALDGTESDPTGDGTNAITQIDSTVDFTAVAAFSAPYTVLANKTYRIKILGTTGAADVMSVQGANVLVNRK